MAKGYPISYNNEELQFLIENQDLPRKTLTKKFNQKFNRNISTLNLSNKCIRLGFKPQAPNKFKKGYIPWNKGVKNYVNKGSFKQGNLPHNTLPIGTERISKANGLVLIKVSHSNDRKERWRNRSALVWEQHHGEIPEDCVIIHINGNQQDDRIENLRCVTQKELLYLNAMHYCHSPSEIKPAIDALTQLKIAIASKRK